MNILGLIPARRGSKGVPMKNIKLLGGKPLIQYSIDAAIKAKYINKVMVSTDCSEISEISRVLGAEVPELRPPYLATDDSPTIDTVTYVINYYKEKAESFDAVCLLQPTSPFRTTQDIDEAIMAFQKQKTDSLISVLPLPNEYNPHWTFEWSEAEKSLKLSMGGKNIISSRQELPATYFRSGSIYLIKTDVLINQRTLYGDKIGFIVTNPHRHVNIDTLEDWERAEAMVEKITDLS